MCAYQPPTQSNESVGGMARVLLNPKQPNIVRVQLTRKDKSGNDVTVTYDLKKDNCPKYIKSGLWRIKLSANAEKMWSAIPSDANLVCVFAGISHKEGEIPTPKWYEPRNSNYEGYFQFVINFKVVEGEFEGIEIPVFVRYNFGPTYDEKGRQIVQYIKGGKKSIHTPFLKKIMDALGVWEKGAMLYKDNILPVIQKRAMAQAEEGRKAVLNLTDGYVTNAKQKMEDTWDEEEDELPSPDEPSNAPVTEPDPDAEEEVPYKKDPDVMPMLGDADEDAIDPSDKPIDWEEDSE